MILYGLYRIGIFLSLHLPLRTTYRLATICADIFYAVSAKDRRAVTANLKIAMGPSVDDAVLSRTARNVFRNFAKYLVDFFRFQKMDKEYIKKKVKLVGMHNIDKALEAGKGVILLSAHIGNWELGGAVTGLSGYPISAVVLTHDNDKINQFFTRQRLMGKVRPIEIGAALKGCYRALRRNELLALLGDRDFTNSGVTVKFFAKETTVPKGPATFSCRLGAPIVPAFLIREADDSFTFFVHEPISASDGTGEAEAVAELTGKCNAAIEKIISRYPEQWYAFRPIWGADAH